MEKQSLLCIWSNVLSTSNNKMMHKDFVTRYIRNTYYSKHEESAVRNNNFARTGYTFRFQLGWLFSQMNSPPCQMPFFIFKIIHLTVQMLVFWIRETRAISSKFSAVPLPLIFQSLCFASWFKKQGHTKLKSFTWPISPRNKVRNIEGSGSTSLYIH